MKHNMPDFLKFLSLSAKIFVAHIFIFIVIFLPVSDPQGYSKQPESNTWASTMSLYIIVAAPVLSTLLSSQISAVPPQALAPFSLIISTANQMYNPQTKCQSLMGCVYITHSHFLYKILTDT